MKNAIHSCGVLVVGATPQPCDTKIENIFETTKEISIFF
jgi:hypothetical protein